MIENKKVLEDPLLEKALPDWAVATSLTHHSPTQFSLPTSAWIAKYLVLTQEERRALSGNAQMFAGVTANNVLQDYYADTIWSFGPHGKLQPQQNKCKGQNKDELINKHLNNFKNYEPTDEKDQAKKEKYLDEVLQIINHGFSALEILGAAKSSITCEEQVSIQQDFSSLFLPVVGRIDFKLNSPDDRVNLSSIIELKTTYSRLGKVKKNGERSFFLSPLPAAPKFNHLIQTAFYAAYYNYKIPVYLLYVNKEGYKIFNADNCYDLTVEGMKRLFSIMCRTFRQREKLLSLGAGKSKDEIIQGAIDLTSAEFDHPWSWSSFSNEQMQRFKELWQVA